MKVQININSTTIEGYHQINPMTGGSINSLPFADNEITHLLADTVCDYIPRHELGSTLKYYASKIRKNGRITIGGTEVKELARMALLTEDYDSINTLLYGSFNSAWSIKSGMTSIIEIIDALTVIGFKVVKKKIDNQSFIVEAIRE